MVGVKEHAHAGLLTVVGLGPGRWEHLTLEAWDVLQAATTVYVRTARHPSLDDVRRRLTHVRFISFDDVYERAPSFDAVYEEIAGQLVALAAAEGGDRPVVFAVPGHPLVGERVTALLLERAGRQGIALRLVEGLSFLEPVVVELGFDPLGSGLLVLDAASLAEAPEGWDGQGIDAAPDPRVLGAPSPRLIDTGRPLVLAQLYSPAVASAAKLWLLERYPPDHPCLLVRAAGAGDATRRLEVPLAELDHATALPTIDYLTTLYVPPLERLHDLRSLHTLAGIVDRLRAPNGCPWDREQDHQTLKPHLIEEAYEVLDALEQGDWDNLVEELGDLFLQVVMHAQFAEEAGTFDLGDVAEGINAKLVRRHPHVFGDVEAGTSGQVLANWEAIKRTEKKAGGAGQAARTLLEGVPRTLPALAAAQTISRKAARVGFEWTSADEVYAKLAEEIAELRVAGSAGEQREEAGDILLTVVNLCRLLGLDAEEALRLANRKFSARYTALEQLAGHDGRPMSAIPPSELRALWSQAKEAAGHET